MTIGILGNPEKPDLAAAVDTLVEILRRRSIGMVVDEAMRDAFARLEGICEFRPAVELRQDVDVVIAFGGDGTMLAAGRLLAGSDVPLLGVNLGKLGFLAEFSVDSLEETIDALESGAVRVERRTLVEARFPDNPEQQPLIALNDVVIDKRGGALMLKLEAYINGDYLASFSADGLIVATPTGSTAYALSVGGPVIAPEAGVLVVAPIAPHMLTARPVVIADDSVVDVYLRPSHHAGSGDGVHVIADGQLHRNIPMPTRVMVQRYEHALVLVKRTSRTYFDVLRAKLLWGREPLLNDDRATAAGEHQQEKRP